MDRMPARPPRRRRARPVADAPVDALVSARERLAKGWLLALLEEAPLVEAPSIVAGGVVLDGPRLCEAVVRALASDAELGGIEAPALSVVEPDAISQALEALRAVVWSALLSELRDPDPELVAALSERLALVIELVRGAALRSARDASENSWVAVLDEQISEARRAGKPVSLLLVELDDAERVLAVEPVDEARALFGRVSLAIEDATGPQDVVAREANGRAWIVAPGRDRASARMLASRVDDALRAVDEWRGAPLTVSVGIAVLGEDASDRDGLIEAAEEARFAAAAGGITVTRGDPEARP
jgi:GGDEF domain-containing protein